MLDEKTIAIRVSQILFDDPVDHDWAAEADAVLIELVRNFDCAADFAGSALSELFDREHAAAGDLCLFLLAHQEADRWLKFQAVKQLPATHREKGFDILLDLIHRCDAGTLALLVYAIHGEVKNDLPMPVRNHPLIATINALSSHEEAIFFAGSLSKNEFIQAGQLADPNRISWWKFMLSLGVWAISAGILAWLGNMEIPAVMMWLLGLALMWMGKQLEREHDVVWDRNPDCRGHVFGTINEDGIEVHGENFRRFTAWSKLTHWNFSGDDLLVVLSPMEARAFPSSFFADSTAWVRAQRMCVEKLPPLAQFKLL